MFFSFDLSVIVMIIRGFTGANVNPFLIAASRPAGLEAAGRAMKCPLPNASSV